MTGSPTPVERTAIRTAYAALHEASSPNSEIVEQIVFALGAAGLLMDPETAAELVRLRARVAELEAAKPLSLRDLPPDPRTRRLVADLRAAAAEDPHDSPLHHSYRVARDLPAGGEGR